MIRSGYCRRVHQPIRVRFAPHATHDVTTTGLFRGGRLAALVAPVLLLASVTMASVASDVAGPPTPRPVKSAPEFQLPDLQGGLVDSRYGTRPVTVVHFWASWCVPCMREIPELNRLSETWKRDRVGFFAIALQSGSPGELRQIARTYDIRHTVLLGDEALARKFGEIPSFPTTFVVDGRGQIVRTHTGATPETRREIESIVREILARPAAAPPAPPTAAAAAGTAPVAIAPETPAPEAAEDSMAARCARAADQAIAATPPEDSDKRRVIFENLHACWLDVVEDDDREGAVVLAERGNQLFGEEPQSGFDLGAAYLLARRDPKTARTVLEGALSRKGRYTKTAPRQRALALGNLGQILLGEEDPQARARLSEALRIDASQTNLLYPLAAADRLAGDSAACLKHIEAALAQRPEAATRDDYLVAAWAYGQRGKHAEAEAVLRQAIGRYPNGDGLHFNLGLTLAARSRPVEALLEYLYEVENGSAENAFAKQSSEKLRDGLAKSPADPAAARAVGQLASVLSPKTNDPASSIADLDRLAESGYHHATLELLRAGALYATGERFVAERVLRTLNEVDPAFLPAYFDLSQILTDTSRVDEARRLVAEAARRNPQHWMLTGQMPAGAFLSR